MTLTEMIVSLRIELQDPAGVAVWSDADLTRAVNKTVSLLGRYIPKKDIIETTITLDISDETLTIYLNVGSTAYKPIKYNSEVITTAAGVKKTRDTDYTINYLTGKVAEVGANLPDANYIIDYKLDQQKLDISSLLPNYIRIERIEYPVGDTPVSYSTFGIMENLVLLNKDLLVEGKHLRIIYLDEWDAPTASVAGEYPVELDNTIIIGAAGQALIYRAERLVSDAVITLGTAKTTLGSIAAELTAADIALDKLVTYLEGATAPSAKIFLDTGDELINKITAGVNVGTVYADYAQRCIGISSEFVSEAIQRLSVAGTYLSKSTREQAIAGDYLTIAGRCLASGQAKINEFLAAIGFKPELQKQKAEVAQPSY